MLPFFFLIDSIRIVTTSVSYAKKQSSSAMSPVHAETEVSANDGPRADAPSLWEKLSFFYKLISIACPEVCCTN